MNPISGRDPSGRFFSGLVAGAALDLTLDSEDLATAGYALAAVAGLLTAIVAYETVESNVASTAVTPVATASVATATQLGSAFTAASAAGAIAVLSSAAAQEIADKVVDKGHVLDHAEEIADAAGQSLTGDEETDVEIIKDILADVVEAAVKAALVKQAGERTAWFDPETGIFVVDNGADSSAYAPDRGRAYFDEWPNVGR